MARAMLLALAFAELASGARYVDYGGVKMPQYGGGADYEGPRDEYDDHSKDILSGAHDYRDEDELIGKTEKLIKEVEETEVWHESTVKYRRQSSTVDDGDIDTLDKYSPEEMVPKFKPSNRFAKHRSLKIRDFEREDVPRRRPLKTQVRHRVEDLVRKDDFDELLPGNFRSSKHSDLFDDSMEFNHRGTTARVIRRKPRDRFDKVRSDSDDPFADLGLNLRGRGPVKDDFLDDFRSDTDYRRGGGPPRRTTSESGSDEDFHRAIGSFRRAPGMDSSFRDKEESMEKSKHLQDYSDYYDMKRVQSIKNKLPSLMRKSTEPPLARTRQSMPFRRVDGGPVLAPMPNPALPSLPVFTTPNIIMPFLENTSPVVDAAAPSVVTLIVTPVVTHKINSSVLSLADKSKLSILKSLKKESGLHTSSTKPPVLLQVTNKGLTVVMVEQQTPPNPLQLVRVVSDDSPDMLKRAKYLMRQKLLANSKSLRDLTENWDSMICDYIDTSLLTEDLPVPYTLSSSNINLCTPIVFIIICLHYIVLKE